MILGMQLITLSINKLSGAYFFLLPRASTHNLQSSLRCLNAVFFSICRTSIQFPEHRLRQI